MAWYTLILPPENQPPLTQDQVDGILTGRLRVYYYAWSRWKDAPDDYQMCLTMQPPKSRDLQSQKLVWHNCAN